VHLVEIASAGEFHFITATDPEKELERKELHYKLDQAIETLPQQAKIVFRLIKENDMKYKEVAEILAISPRTVQTQLFRAIAKLRVILQSYHQAHVKTTSSNKLMHIIFFSFILQILR
jgi:RNA polymerase sigma-70 factor (ECF subfamily)